MISLSYLGQGCHAHSWLHFLCNLEPETRKIKDTHNPGSILDGSHSDENEIERLKIAMCVAPTQ